MKMRSFIYIAIGLIAGYVFGGYRVATISEFTKDSRLACIAKASTRPTAKGVEAAFYVCNQKYKRPTEEEINYKKNIGKYEILGDIQPWEFFTIIESLNIETSTAKATENTEPWEVVRVLEKINEKVDAFIKKGNKRNRLNQRSSTPPEDLKPWEINWGHESQTDQNAPLNPNTNDTWNKYKSRK